MQEKSVDLKAAFSFLPGNNILVLPDMPMFTIVGVSDEYLKVTGRTRDLLMGKGLFEVFPNNPYDANKVSEKTVRASLEYVIAHKEAHQLPVQRYDVANCEGAYEERYWKARNKPILSNNGEVLYLIHSIEEVTEKIKAEQTAANIRGMEKAYNFFMNAPVIIGLVSGDEYVIEMANDGLLGVWGRTSAVVGKPLMQAIPELKEQGFKALLDQVRTTGAPYHTYEYPIVLNRHGKEEVLYFDFIYKPYYENGNGKANGVISVGHDVTAQVLARNKVKESEAKYRSLFDSIDQGFCIIEMIFDQDNKPIDYRFLEVNPVFEKQTCLQDAVGKTILQLAPDFESRWFELYGKVALTGEPSRFTEGSDALGRWFEVYAFRIGGDKSQNVAVLFSDITDRNTAEQALRESEDRLKKILSIETVGVLYFDMEGCIKDANAAFERISGYTHEEIGCGSVRWNELTPPEFMEVTLKGIEELRSRGESTPFEKQYIRPDGSRWWGLFAGKRLSENECVEFVVDITEQKKAQEALAKSESNLRNMILQSPIAMAILRGPDHVVEVANNRMYELWGREPVELLNRSIFAGLPEVKNQGYEDLLNGVFTTGKTFTANGIPVTLPRDGRLETVYINLLYEAFREGDGTISGVMAVATDVTEQVMARIKVEASHQELQFMMDAMPQLVWVTKPDGYHDGYNQKWYEYTGLSHVETKGTGWNGVVHPDHQERAWEVWRRSLETGEPYEIEYCLKRYDGVYRWFLGRALPLRDASGTILKWFGTCTDIDDQKRAEVVLEQSEARTRLAVEAAHLGTFDINIVAQTIIHSPRAAEIFGLDAAKQWPYTAFTDAVHPDDVSIRNQAHAKARQTGELLYEVRIIRPDTSIRWIRLNGKLTFQNTTPVTMVGTVIDVTEEKRASELLEQKIEERTRELRQVNDQLKQFTYAASHDLQEPLRKVSFFLDRLLSNIGPSLSEENKSIAERIEHTTKRMRTLIDDLLAYSNTTLGITGFEQVDLADVVQEVLEDMEVTIIEKGALIDVQQLPQVRGDHRQLRQLFQNLITNAVKYHKQGAVPQVQIASRLVRGEEIEASIPVERKSALYHQIQVRDNGIGFHPDDGERIFKLFQRLHGKAEYPGTGVGLAIVQKVVENHHGFICAKGEPGNGATFIVFLPAE